MNNLKNLPIGIQTFKEIVDNDYLYIDKTRYCHSLIDHYKYVFLSRPRRFGKSLLMDTIHNIYEANKELFTNLYIYDNWDWETAYPVIKISFSGGIRDEETFHSGLLNILKANQHRLDVACNSDNDVNSYFSDLIEKTYQKYNRPVVILVDEYDKPILDNLAYIDQAIIIRDRLRDFYSQIKDNDRYLKFAMLTGVSRFSKVSIFSGLNNLTDISLNKNYASVCGYTEEELDSTVKPYLKGVDRQALRTWYNGFNFMGEKVYNPYDILLFIDNDQVFNNYWFDTGTPSFLINLIKEKNYFLPDFENIRVDEKSVNSFDIDNLSIESIMLQAGYLTIKEVKNRNGRNTYHLDFPNFEVRTSFYDYVLHSMVQNTHKAPVSDDLYDIFDTGNVQALEPVIRRLFASIAYNNYTNNYIENYEGFYASVIYAYLASLGLEMIAEDVSNHGRIDLALKMNNRVFVFEFKVSNEEPLRQVKEKKYYEKYNAGSIQSVYLISIVFDKRDRNICQFEWEEMVL